MKFDHDRPSEKIRAFGAPVTHIQSGHVFTAGYVHIGKVGAPPKPQVADVVPKSSKEKKEEIRARAAEKLADFREDETSEGVALALSENAAAAAAEDANA